MKRFLLLLLFIPGLSFAAGDAPIELEHVKINVHDRAALMRGAKYFAQNCMVCHTMKYLRHDKLAQKAGITLDKMPLKNKEWWLNVVPPDLSLIASERGADWLYTYFHAFYKDDKRPTGFNNLLVPNLVMTNVFLPFQGEQALIDPSHTLFTKLGMRKPRYFQVLKLVKSGTMSPEQFNQSMMDLVTFLVYASDPTVIERERLGWWVIGFLLILFVLAFFLAKEYWRDVE